ncbi:glucan endo-1,3-beta-glucosidase 13-like [Salvia miltiorrhiza]|uniref:glucan endo-1,3-beta-glucosidase 13-like n=1 Tax=Salvia miltiorrhiza TaxID=226208 RepID=UPI0025AB6944|nr:glucan endo-1,3-beta-glucosidase 13-like [Salvia miltiorrhiza]
MGTTTLLWAFLNIVIMQCFLGSILARKIIVQEKADASIPITSVSPPEGNTTFLAGTNWCVARPGVPQNDLKIALDWACGLGRADCRAIQAGGPCFEPNTLLSHASYAFNNYYQQNGNNAIACHFGGTAALTHYNPSYGRCSFITSSESLKASSASSFKYKAKGIWWKIHVVIVLLLYLSRKMIRMSSNFSSYCSIVCKRF